MTFAFGSLSCPHIIRCGTIIFVLLLAGLRFAPAANLVPHRAEYSLEPLSAAPMSDVVGIKGTLTINLEASCDGWTNEQFLGFLLAFEGGEQLEHVAHFSGWETDGGETFWFSSKTYKNRALADEASGHATLDATAGGTARFAKPKDVVLPLPKATHFPIAHVSALIDAAADSRRQVAFKVFDGSTTDLPSEVATVIGKPRSSSEEPALAGVRAWPMRLAYFDAQTLKPAPKFQMDVLLYENGIAGDMVYDYDNFSVAVTLDSLEIRPPPRCP